MLPVILPKSKFEQFVGFLMSGSRLVAPVAKGHQFAFADIEAADAGKIRMDYDITILPPKKYVLPTYEQLLEFDGPKPSQVRATVPADKGTVILGVHPYDLHGLGTIDAAFTTDPADANYQARRSSLKVIGLNINGGYVNEHQFMADMKTMEPPAGSFDLFMTDLGDRYYVEIGSPAGKEMTGASQLFKPAAAEDHKAKQEFERIKAEKYPARLPYDTRYLGELLDGSYDSLLWDAVARRCFSCGTCTNVCPTCYCFDVQDKLNLDASSGVRQRMWDSCQLEVFAEVAGGENFREHRSSRLRHRMFRKGKYIQQRTGRTGCVGCGRCSRHCVASISILETFQQIADQEQIQA